MEKRFDARMDAFVSELRGEFRSGMSELRSEVHSGLAGLASEIKVINQRLDSLEKRLDRVERQLEAMFKPALPR
jgi:chaperonin cofactor prefoldin